MAVKEQSQLLRLLAAMLVSPPASALTVGFAFMGTAILVPHVMIGALFVGYLAMILLGLPVHVILTRCNWRNGLFYAAGGAAVGSLLNFGTSRLVDPEVVGAIEEMTVAGAVCAGLFWLIRRPDRDQPPVSSSNETSA